MEVRIIAYAWLRDAWTPRGALCHGIPQESMSKVAELFGRFLATHHEELSRAYLVGSRSPQAQFRRLFEQMNNNHLLGLTA